MDQKMPGMFQPRCPRCRSVNLLPLSKETFVKAGIGAGIGGSLAALALLIDKESGESELIPSIITGVMTGAVAGIFFGTSEPEGSITTEFLCLKCFHRFTWIKGPII